MYDATSVGAFDAPVEMAETARSSSARAFFVSPSCGATELAIVRAVSSMLGEIGARMPGAARGSLVAIRSSMTSCASDARGDTAASGLREGQRGSLYSGPESSHIPRRLV